MRARLDRSDIQRGLNRLLELCVDSGLDVRVQIVGGGAILLKYNEKRQSTVDVDCVVLGEFEHRQKFAEFVLTVASEFNWPVDWMNHNVGIFWPEVNEDAGWVKILERGASRVEVAGPRMLLAMKLRAGRPVRDMPDIARLLDVVGVNSIVEAEAVFDEYFPYDVMPERTIRWLNERLTR
jgi:hypothetical protein